MSKSTMGMSVCVCMLQVTQYMLDIESFELKRKRWWVLDEQMINTEVLKTEKLTTSQSKTKISNDKRIKM